MKNVWTMTQARREFEAVVDATLNRGPQIITRYGKPIAYVVSAALYAALSAPVHRKRK